MTLRHTVTQASPAGLVSLRALWGLISGVLVIFISPSDAHAEVDIHLLSAQRHAKASANLQRLFQASCHGKPTASEQVPANVATLAQIEKKFRVEREMGHPQQVQRLIERECLAYRLAQQEPGFSAPVWYLGQLKVVKIKPYPDDTMEVTAQAGTLAGPIVNSRVTFSAGLHLSCFGYTDIKGQVRCRLVDTHPHGNAHEAGHESNDGPLVASLQGKVSPDLIEWPTSKTIQFKLH